MPTTLPRRKPKPPSRRYKILFWVAVALVICIVRSFAAHADGFTDHMLMGDNELDATATGPAQPGDYGYEHMQFHEAIYSHLTRNGKDNCCKGYECRVTEPLRPADPVYKAVGYDAMVKVDRHWCPVKLAEHLVTFTPAQQKLAKTNPLWKEFLARTHVCAARFVINYTESVSGTVSNFSFDFTKVCPTIYCIVDGGDRT
jgi:hypothetical protein